LGITVSNSSNTGSVGVVLPNVYGKRTLAHEIGHFCKLFDIYIPKNLTINSDKWLGGNRTVNGKYYKSDLIYPLALRKFLMYGIGFNPESNIPLEIPVNKIYGVEEQNGTLCKFIDIGLECLDREPKTYGD
jgi:hypothetical protein